MPNALVPTICECNKNLHYYANADNSDCIKCSGFGSLFSEGVCTCTSDFTIFNEEGTECICAEGYEFVLGKCTSISAAEIVAEFSDVQLVIASIFIEQLSFTAEQEILFLETLSTTTFEKNFDLTLIFESLTFDESISVMVTEMVQDVKFESLMLVAAMVANAEVSEEFEVATLLESFAEISFFEISIEEVSVEMLTTIATSFVAGIFFRKAKIWNLRVYKLVYRSRRSFFKSIKKKLRRGSCI